MDAFSRLIAEKLSASMGQPVIVENKAGASGSIGAATVAQSKPDGYTILFAIASTIQSVSLKSPTFKLSELIANHPTGRLACRLRGSEHLASQNTCRFREACKGKAEQLELRLLRKWIDRPSSGRRFGRGGQNRDCSRAVQGRGAGHSDLLGGHISSAFGSVGSLAQYPDAVRLIAITGSKRLRRFSDVPTFRSRDFRSTASPAGPVCSRRLRRRRHLRQLAVEIDRVVRLPEMQTKILDMGFEPVGN